MNEEADIEALQAQIELSNSVAYDIVSSWMKPTLQTSKESISDTISRELEEFAKRPHRLGLGAIVPKSTVATAREAAKLKGKLIGRKRVRDEEGSVSTIGKTTIADDSEEEESRTTAISRKPEETKKLFVTGKGKEKYVSNKGDEQKSQVNIGEGEMRPSPFIVPKTPPSNFPSLNREVSSLDIPSPSKKRRKKKEKDQDEPKKHDTKGIIEEEDEWTGFGDSFKDLVETAIVSAEGPEEPTAHSPNMPSGSTTISSLSEVSVSAAKFSHDASPASSVLNLNGPPAPNSLEMPGSGKKRRRRRKKDKKEQGTGGVEGTTFL